MLTAGGGAATSWGSRDHSFSRSPFTPTQWQELEHQALIFKYMMSGVPIPPELIYSVKRSLDSSLASRLLPTQHAGWGGFQVGFGRKSDPEPGRCRRTDGKKWRCSKEAYLDSKYCERHMHRGKNRSRKPVEAPTSSATTTTIPSSSSITATNPSSILSLDRKFSINTSSSSNSSSTYPFSPLLSSSISPELYAHQETALKSISHLNPYLYSYSSSSSRHPGSSGLSTHDNMTSHHLFPDSGSCSHTDKDYSYSFHGTREGAVDERAFFPAASGNLRSFQDSCHPYGSYSKAYSHHSQFQSFSDSSKQQQGQQHCFVLGTDFKSSAATATARPLKTEKEEDETQKPLHHFFGEWPPKNTESWLDLSSNSKIRSDS